MNRSEGYTLIEVVTALALLALLAVPLASLLTQGYFHYQRAGGRTREAAAAVALLEELKAREYSLLLQSLGEERLPGEEYPYAAGRNNYFEGSPEAGDERSALSYRLHLLQESYLLNQEPLLLEVLLVEVLDSQGGLLLSTCISGWKK